MASTGGKGVVGFAEVFKEECRELKNAWPPPEACPRPDELVGLAFSGGGIRSATFNLGVLRGLASLGLLPRFHYLSTVSGGGYIGSWLARWCWRSGIADVEEKLRGWTNGKGRGGGGKEDQTTPDVEPPEVSFLRAHSNYLTPRLGAFSHDTWAVVATYLRNLLLNQLVLVTFLAATLLLPYLVLYAQRGLVAVSGAVASVGIALAFGAIVFASREMALLRYLKGTSPSSPETVLLSVVAPLVIAPWLVSPWLLVKAAAPTRDWDLVLGAVACGLLYALAAAVGAGEVRRRAEAPLTASELLRQCRVAVYAALAGAVGGGLLVAALRAAPRLSPESVPGTFIGPLALTAAVLLTGFLHTGLARNDLLEEQREWRSRLAGVLMLWAACLALIPLAVFVGPPVLAWLARRQWVNWTMVLGWAGSTLGGVLLGRAPTTGPLSRRPAPTAIAQAAALVFIVGLVLLVAAGLPGLIEASRGVIVQGQATIAGPSCEQTAFDSLPGMVCLHFRRVEGDAAAAWPVFLLVALVALGLSMRIGLNEFSMHAMYRDRLVRCYLGATNPARHEGTFTGNDARDDVPLAKVSPAATPAHRGPYLIVNACLNLMRGRRLAWQSRKGASFVMSPLYCGWEAGGEGGYRSTASYADGLSLGTAMATSGAAACPNMGYHSAPLLAVLMTVFNVRLGQWFGNPGRSAWQKTGPTFGPLYLLCELFGLADDQRDFVYVSDGGHFENLGLYELVRRKCRFIVACDAAEDSGMKFTDLGNAVEKCRTDLGAEIVINVDEVHPGEPSGSSRRHGAVGQIRYQDGSVGTLLYVKSSLTGDEPTDVSRYAATQPAFPHQTTADQFFDETQFESYRVLGEHAILSLIGPLGDSNALAELSNEDLFLRLRQHWYPSSGHVAEHFTRYADAIDRVFGLIRSTPELEFMDAQIYPEWGELQPSADRVLWLPEDPASVRAGFYVCNQMIQLMESVYLDLDLERELEHPDNRGWMNLFRRWAGSGMLRVTWAVCGGTYGARFQTFCERHLGLRPGKVVLGPAARVPKPVVTDWPSGVDWLNPFERRLLTEISRKLQALGTMDLAGLSVFPLQLAIEDPLEPPDRPARQYFTLGLALLDERPEQPAIRYLRIQNHVRTMGLGRHALRAIFEKYAEVRLDPFPKDAWPDSERIDESQQKYFERLFRSVTHEHEARSKQESGPTGKPEPVVAPGTRGGETDIATAATSDELAREPVGRR